MKIHCPRCHLETEQFSLDLIENGVCPDCGGQVYFGPVLQGEDFVLGILFEPGCNVAIPIEMGPSTAEADFETTDANQLDEGMSQTPEVEEPGELKRDPTGEEEG